MDVETSTRARGDHPQATTQPGTDRPADHEQGSTRAHPDDSPTGTPGRRRLLPASPPGWPVVVVALGLALLGMALAAAALLSGADGLDGSSPDRLRAQALDAARERTAALTTYDHRTLDEDLAAVLENATGPFAEDYARTTEELRPTFAQTQAVAEGTVLGAGIEDFAERRVVVVVVVDQVLTTAGQPARREGNRLRMVLVRPEDTWLVEQVQRL